MIKKIFFAILILVGAGGNAGVVLLHVYSVRYFEDVEFRCQVDMQFARLTNVLINRDGTFPIIEDAKERCEWWKETEKRREDMFRDFQEAREEYYRKKGID